MSAVRMLDDSFYMPQPPAEACSTFADAYAPWLLRQGYVEAVRTSRSLSYKARYTPNANILLGVILLPLLIGLIFFFLKSDAFIHVSFEPEGEGSAVRVNGLAPLHVKSKLEELARGWDAHRPVEPERLAG